MSTKLTAIYIGLMKLKKRKKHVINGGRMTEQEFQAALKKLNND